jgi:hypothetical protein
MWGEKQKETITSMVTIIKKLNFNNNEWKIVCTHMQLLIIDIDKKVNVFKVKYLGRVMYSHGVQS